MKKNLILLCAALSLASCTTVNYKEDLDTFKDCVTYVEDSSTGTVWVSNTATVKTIYDYYYEAYTVEMKDLQLYDGATLADATWQNLYQYFQETSTDDDTPLYYFFRQEGSTRSGGDIEVSGMRYGFLSNTYWMSFNAQEERYRVWSMPRVRTIYASRNTINCGGIRLEENAIQPAWRFKLDPAAGTVTIDAKDVHLRQDENDPNKTLVLRELLLPAIPVTFTARGFEFEVTGPLIPTVNGQTAPQYEINNFRGQIAFDYEGAKTLTYDIYNGDDKLLQVSSEFSLLRK